jgi:hypothetical protein
VLFLRATSTTCEPPSANTLANSRPIPEEAPVISAVSEGTMTLSFVAEFTD